MAEFLMIVVNNLKLQNQISIMKYDNDHQPTSEIWKIHYQTHFIVHHHYYRMGHHQNQYHQNQNYLMKYIHQFESSLMTRSLE